MRGERDAPFLVGIDLGTTHTVVAYARSAPGDNPIQLFAIEQLVAAGEVAAQPMLPSQRYHPAPGELPPGDLQLPWPQTDVAGLAQVVIGRLARQLGAQVPGRLVASAKSWLSHAGVDRLAPVLPWGAAEDVAKVSPVAASASYLAHVRAAWNTRFSTHPLEQQDVVLTVPASFDDGARALTVEAARLAGLPQLRLLEEPQAAFYDWLYRHRGQLAAELAESRLVLVCDVGGGTTDLSLIKVELQPDGEPKMTRVGVGNHLMLGGDNMDLALAHVVEARLAAGQAPGAGRLSASRLSQLVERCRAAKEQLLAADAPERVSVTLLGAGSRLVGGARSAELTRAEAEQIVVDGFFPPAAADELPKRARAGLVEFGLPYASDPAVTRHLAGFLQQHAAAVREALGDEQSAPVPDTLLLNGGVFRAGALGARLLETLGNWRGRPLRLLHNDGPDLAVARGAVAYALARRGSAPKIGGGSARSYFLVLDGDGETRGVCLLPQGAEEGKEIRLDERSFALRVGQPVRFHLVSSTSDAGQRARPGDLLPVGGEDFLRLPPIATVVSAQGAGQRRDIPVQLATSLTEVGTLEVHCVAVDDPVQRWRLEFQLRGEAAEADTPAVAPGFDEALEMIDRIFGTRAKGVAPKEVKQLRAQLEHRLGARERWAPPLLRSLFDALWQRARGRRRSAEHERLWLNLIGYCLRPGFGYPLDDWRIEQLWPIFEQGVQHPNDAQVCAEWWTLWRRVAGGLPDAAQRRLLDDFAQNTEANEHKGASRPASVVKGGTDEMLRLGATLERIPVAHKIEIGQWLLGKLDAATPDPRVLWAIGRIGARQPFHGGAEGAVPAEVAGDWLDKLLALDWKRADGAAFASAHLARMTGDRSRDLPDALRERVIARLEAYHAAPSWVAMVREAVALDEAAERHVFGEALPPGLKLIA